MYAALDTTLPNLLAFCRTFELGSFTLAAKALRVTPAAVSRSVARLESALGTALFRRTTRQLRPTERGAAYYAKCAAALRLLIEAESELADRPGELRGSVRVSVPSTYGLHLLLPRMGDFRARFPAIDVEVQVTQQNVDFVRDGVDLAIRMGTPEDAGLVVRKLGDFPLGLYASRSHLELLGAVLDLDALHTRPCVAFVMPRTARVLPWLLAAPHLEFTPPAAHALKCGGDPAATVALCQAGAGVAQLYRFIADPLVRRGLLEEVLAHTAGRTRRFSLLYPKLPGLSKPARAVADYMYAQRQAPMP
jgi:DNA-binding transcriptional LysR family regulator